MMTFTAISWFITLALTGFLVWGFLRTRNFGYLVLLIPFTLWHFLSFGSREIVDSQLVAIRGGQGLAFPFSLIDQPTAGYFVAVYQVIIGIVRGLFILLGFYLLVRRSPKVAGVPQGTGDQQRQESSVPV